MGSLYSVSELRGSLYLVVLPDILYAFIYLINGRLEAYGINSVLYNCVLLKSSHHILVHIECGDDIHFSITIFSVKTFPTHDQCCLDAF